jgi:hypothetical protein
VYIAIISTFALTCLGCWKIFSLKLKRALRAQEEAMRNASQERFAELISRFHHESNIKEASSLSGLISITLWAVWNCIIQLETLSANKDWNTKEHTSELRAIASNELGLIRTLIDRFLAKGRDILKDYNEDQGVK